MTTSADLRSVAVQALTGTTAAGTSVFSPRDQASWDGEYPVIFVRVDDEDGKSFGPHGPPAFTVTATLRVEARASASALPNDAGAGQLLASLETLRDQIKAAVINYPALMSMISQFSAFRTRIVREADEAADHLGAAVVEIDMEFVQGWDEFYQPPVVPLDGIDATYQMPNGTTEPGLTLNLPQT